MRSRQHSWQANSQIKNVLVGKDGKADAATKLECDYLAQILLPSIKAQDQPTAARAAFLGRGAFSYFEDD